MVTLSLSLVVALSTLPLSSFAASHNHNALNRRHHANVNAAPQKRGNNADATWYVINTGQQTACGGFHEPSEWVIAMNQQDFPGSCHKQVTIEWQGKQTTATVVDECGTTGCLNRGIDLTQSLFEFFAPTSVGDLKVNWWFTDSAPATPPLPPPPTTTSKPPPPPTSTYKPPPPPPSTTSKPPPPPSTTTTTHSTTHTTSHSTTTTSAAPTPTVYSNIAGLYQAVVGMGSVELKVATAQQV